QSFRRPALPRDEHPTNSTQWFWRVLAVAILAVYACLSIALVHDCFSWNRARWTLGRRAVANHIPAQAIEGGFEWDGWRNIDGPGRSSRLAAELSLLYTRRTFPAVTGQYAMSFQVLPATVVEDSEKCELWLQPGSASWHLNPHYSLIIYLVKAKW